MKTHLNGNFIPHMNGGALALHGNDLFVTAGDSINEYNATTGDLITANFITAGLHGPVDMVFSGNHLYVVNSGTGDVNDYDATTGAPIKYSLFYSTSHYIGIFGNEIFVPNSGGITNYDATTGNRIGEAFYLPGAVAVTVSGNDLYALAFSAINEYDLTTGQTIASIAYAPSGPVQIIVAPEPGSATLLVAGLGVLCNRRRRQDQ